MNLTRKEVKPYLDRFLAEVNLSQGAWDPELLALFGVPVSALSEVPDSSAHFGEANLGTTKPGPICRIPRSFKRMRNDRFLPLC